MIIVDSVFKEYDSLVAVKNLSLQVKAGEIVGLVGPNGAGKTSLMKCLAGIARQSAGRILIGGQDIIQSPMEAKRLLAFVPEFPALYDDLTVWEHIQFSGNLYRAQDIDSRAEGLLRRFDLTDKKHDLISTLSKGMKQKTALSCALVHQPKALVLDEPLIGLDPKAARAIRDILLEEAATGTAVLISSHQLDLVERLCKHIVIVRQGEVVIQGSLADIHAKAGLQDGASLEDMFLHLTDDDRQVEESSGSAGDE